MRLRTRLAASVAAACALLLVPPAALDAQPDVDGEGWYHIAFDQRITTGDRRAVLEAGFGAAQYWPADGYLAWGDALTAEALRDHPRLAAVRPVTAEDKIHRSLRSLDGAVTAVATVYGPALASATREIGELGRIVEVAQPITGDDLGLVVAETPTGYLERIADVPAVLHVGPAMTDIQLLDEGASQVLAGNVEEPRRIEPGYQEFLEDVGVDGSGVVLAISDNGVDDNHPDLAGRMVARQPQLEVYTFGVRGRICVGCDRGHGTPVAGAALGAAAELPVVGQAQDADGLRYGLGAAPAASYLDMGTLSSSQPEAGTSWALDHGAVGLNGSWSWVTNTLGDNHRLGYLHGSRNMDMLVRDADPSEPGNEPFLMVFAAGNSGELGMAQPQEAKNIITVGATLSHRAGSVEDLASFSSRGPTADGRLFPTVVAPGDYIIGPRALPASRSCTAVDVGSPSVLRPLPPDGYGLYAPCSGTSFAAPRVAGGAVLLHQWWNDRLGHSSGPSPAMVKALLVDAATPLDAAPNNDEGWGRATLGPLLDPDRRHVVVDQEVTLTDVGETFSVDITPVSTDEPLTMALAWTDAPGAVDADPALVNDLDLEVVAPDGTVLQGNGEADRLNTVETIRVDEPADGTYRVVVRAHNLPAPAIPDHPAAVNQDFALVVSNAAGDGP